VIEIIVIKPGSRVDPAKESGPGFHGSTRVNPDQPGKIKKIFKVLIFHMKKLRKNSCEYRLYML